jgi:hypothetical protein
MWYGFTSDPQAAGQDSGHEDHEADDKEGPPWLHLWARAYTHPTGKFSTTHQYAMAGQHSLDALSVR